MKGYSLDHVFADLVRDEQGRAVMSVKGRSQRLDVTLGPNYRAVVIYAPASDRPFVCFEPMVAITNAMNAAHKGLYKELQTIPGLRASVQDLSQQGFAGQRGSPIDLSIRVIKDGSSP